MPHRPTTRVLATLELLQTHKRMSGSELARRLNVSVRTVRRYVAVLEDMGIPITTEQGRDGAYLLVAGFKLPPMMFTDEEALALSIGLLAARELGVAEAVPAADSAQAKLQRVMPEPVRHRFGDIRDTIHLDIASAASAASNAALRALCVAAHARHRVRFRYESAAGGATSRDFDPYGLSCQRGKWYAVGFCHLRKDLRTFRLDRMQDVARLDASFRRPDGFDVLDFLHRSFAAIPRAHGVEVLLHADLETAKAQPVGKFGFLEPFEDGVVLRARTDTVDWYAGMLACLPFEFEVRTPPALVEALLEIAARVERAVR